MLKLYFTFSNNHIKLESELKPKTFHYKITIKMLSKFASRLTRNDVRKFVSRNIGSTAIILNKTDPIQQLFVDKVRDYFKKKR